MLQTYIDKAIVPVGEPKAPASMGVRGVLYCSMYTTFQSSRVMLQTYIVDDKAIVFHSSTITLQSIEALLRGTKIL